MKLLLAIAGLALGAIAGSTLPSGWKPPNPVAKLPSPQVKTVTIIANVTDPAVTRDSCGSTRIGNRAFWTCRDTQPFNLTTDQAGWPLVVNTASWSDLGDNGPMIGPGAFGAASSGSNSIVTMYGGNPVKTPGYFPLEADTCDASGICGDGTRWVLWPDQPPLVTDEAANGCVTAYTWIKRVHLRDLTLLNGGPATALYKITYTPSSDKNALPTVTLVDNDFWPRARVSYGTHGTVVKDGIAYLYGQTDPPKGIVLAKVPVASVEDKSAYQYFFDGGWTAHIPSFDASRAFIPNAGAGGQGTFYYSAYYACYIWIGQTNGLGGGSADFLLTTAPAPEGPWIEPYTIYHAADGDDHRFGGYSLQAHPGLLPSRDASEKGIYLTWTQA